MFKLIFKEYLYNKNYNIIVMSQVRKVQAANTTEEMPSIEATPTDLQSKEISSEDSQAGDTHARRIVIQANVNADQLKQGYVVKVPNAADVFKPAYNMAQVNEDQKESMDKLDFSKGIVTSIKLKSVYSNVDEPVSVGIKLFQNKPNITNDEGWLFTETNTDMGRQHTSEVEGYVNLVSVLPFEKARTDTDVYTPQNLLNNRFISQYGGYTLDKLWEGIVNFKGKDWVYVEQNHVILQVIQRNWELLGINTDAEVKRENNYVKVSRQIVNNVIKQLYEQVIMQIPYTSFDDMSARFQSNDVEDGEYKVMCEFLVQYKYPAIQNSAKAGSSELV